MTASFPRILPRYALGCYLGAAALLYLFSAQLLAAIDIWLLPRRLLVEMLRYRAMWLVFFLTLPTVGYLLWRGSDLVAWLKRREIFRTPGRDKCGISRSNVRHSGPLFVRPFQISEWA